MGKTFQQWTDAVIVAGTCFLLSGLHINTVHPPKDVRVPKKAMSLNIEGLEDYFYKARDDERLRIDFVKKFKRSVKRTAEVNNVYYSRNTFVKGYNYSKFLTGCVWVKYDRSMHLPSVRIAPIESQYHRQESLLLFGQIYLSGSNPESTDKLHMISNSSLRRRRYHPS